MPEYIAKEATVQTKLLRRRQAEFAEVTAKDAKKLHEKHDEAMKTTLAADTLAYNMQSRIRSATSMG